MVCAHFLDIRQPTSNCQLGQTGTAKVEEEYKPFPEGCDEGGWGGWEEGGSRPGHGGMRRIRKLTQDGVPGGYQAGGDKPTSEFSLWE